MAVSQKNKKRRVSEKPPSRKRKALSPSPETEVCPACKISQDGVEGEEEVQNWNEENFCFEVDSPEGHWCCTECGNMVSEAKTIEIMDKLFIRTKITDILLDLTQKHIRLGCSAGEALTDTVQSCCKDYGNYSQKFILSKIFENHS